MKPLVFLRMALLALNVVLIASVSAQPAGAMRGAAERRLEIEGLDEPLNQVQLRDLEGRDVTDQLRARTERGRVTVALDRPEQFIVKPSAIRTLPLPSDEKVVLPGGVVVPLIAAPDGSAPARMAWLRLTFAASPMPAAWSEGNYLTRLTFGLRRPPDSPESLKLEQPVLIKLAFEGLTGPEIAPVTIEAPGLENEKTVEFRFLPTAARPKLLVRSSISDVNLEMRALPRLAVRPAQREILGWGLGTVDVHIEQVLAHGERILAERAVHIPVEVSGRATMTPAHGTIAPGTAHTTLQFRSAGLGPVTVTAIADGLVGSAIIEQRFPLGPLLAAILGGAVGGYARRFVKGARRRLAGRVVIEGAIVATIAFVAGVLGVGYLSLPAGIVATEAGAFLTGALTGFAGVTVIEAVTRRRGTAA